MEGGMGKGKLLDEVRNSLRTQNYSYRTEKTYVNWIRKFILFHNKRHPREMGEKEINQFLTYLAVNQKVSASTQNQALSALLFLYKVICVRKLAGLEISSERENPKRFQWYSRKKRSKKLCSTFMANAGLRLP